MLRTNLERNVLLGMYSSLPKKGEARSFMDQVKKGINQALSLRGTPHINKRLMGREKRSAA